jgi:hypothetical protein
MTVFDVVFCWFSSGLSTGVELMFAFLAGIPISQPILLALAVTLSVYLIDPSKHVRQEHALA